MSTIELKKKISKLLEEDEEFRYFVASKIGLLEILKDSATMTNKVKFMKRKLPNYLRDNIILVLYRLKVLPKLTEEAEKHGIWIVTATEEFTD